jgi:hypothetical protein
MGYLHINNLYKDRDIRLFRECFALEKIHGTSASLAFKDGQLGFFSGGANYEQFVKLFNAADLLSRYTGTATVYGEAYGGKLQGMSETYGRQMRFVAFDVRIGDCWLSVPQAAAFCQQLGLEFVHYEQVPTDVESLNAQRDADSVQAVRNGMGSHMREGVVLRPLIEVIRNNGTRLIAKHKRDEFRETKTKREVTPEQLAVLDNAKAIAEEWVTPMRLEHVMNGQSPDMEHLNTLIPAMIADVKREAEGEIVWSKEVERAVGKATAAAVKARLSL